MATFPNVNRTSSRESTESTFALRNEDNFTNFLWVSFKMKKLKRKKWFKCSFMLMICLFQCVVVAPRFTFLCHQSGAHR